MRTVDQYAKHKGWDYGEGFIVGTKGKRKPAEHLTGKPLLHPKSILPDGIDETAIDKVEALLFKSTYTPARFSAPMLLIRKHMAMDCGTWLSGYLTYKNEIAGVCGAEACDAKLLVQLEHWFRKENYPLRAFAAAISVRLFTRRATNLAEVDVLSTPFRRSA